MATRLRSISAPNCARYPINQPWNNPRSRQPLLPPAPCPSLCCCGVRSVSPGLLRHCRVPSSIAQPCSPSKVFACSLFSASHPLLSLPIHPSICFIPSMRCIYHTDSGSCLLAGEHLEGLASRESPPGFPPVPEPLPSQTSLSQFCPSYQQILKYYFFFF